MPIEAKSLVLMLKYGRGVTWTRLPDYDNCSDELAWLMQTMPNLETGQTNNTHDRPHGSFERKTNNTHNRPHGSFERRRLTVLTAVCVFSRR